MTTAAGVTPSEYYPHGRKKKRIVRKSRTQDEVKEMNEARLACELVEEYGFSHRDALEIVLEADAEKSAKKMAKKAAPDDPEKQKELEAKFKKNMEKKMKGKESMALRMGAMKTAKKAFGKKK